MKKKHLKAVSIFLLTIVLLSVIFAALIAINDDDFYKNYDTDWLMGKTIDEVVEKYGMFDYCALSNGFIIVKYYISETKNGIFGKEYGQDFYISFNNGIVSTANYEYNDGIGG